MADEIIVNEQHVQLWDRNTIADGYKMAQKTIVPICSAITAGGAAVSAKIQEEIDRATNKETELDEKIDGVAEDLSHEITDRENEDRKLQDQIDTINAGTDVINVYGTYDNFTETSGDLFSTSAITDQDVVKVLNDPNQYPEAGLTAGPHQTYFRWIVSATEPHKPLDPTDGSWNFIGYTDPYYNTAEIDEKFENISATVSNNYLSANGEAVQSGHNIVISAHPTEPKIKIETSSHVTFDGVSSTNLSATSASGSLAKFTTLSGNIIKGETSSINIDNLINSAVNGGALTGLGNIASIYTKNQLKGTTGKIDLHSSADKINIFLSGGIGNWLSLEAEEDIESGNHYIYLGAKDLQEDIDSRLEIYDFNNWSGSTNSVFSGTSRSAQSAGYAETAYSSYSSQSSQYAINAGSAKIAYSAYSATSANNADKLGGTDYTMFMVSSKLYSNTDGVITAYGNSDSKSALGCVGDYLEKSAVNAGVGYAYTVTDSAFAQGVSITSKSASLSQGIGNNAYNKSLAQGVDNTAENASVAQGYANSATNTAQAFGQGLQISGGMAIGKYNYSNDVAFVIGNGTSDSNRKDLLTVTHDGDLKIISAVGSVFQEAHISPSGVTYRSHGEQQPGVTEENATWHQILSTSGVPRAYASDFGQVLAVDSAANTLDWSDRYKLKKGVGAYDDCFETSQQIKRTDNSYTYIYIENTERRICLGVSQNGNVRLGEETGRTRSPTTAKSIIYSENTGDNTTYHFNGSSEFAKTANSAYSAYYAQSAISSYYSEESEDSVRLGNRPSNDYALTGGTYTASNQLKVNSAINANNTTKWNGYELLLGSLPTQGQNQIAFI